MRYYFAYGSNMSTRQMNERCPSAERVGLGALKTFRVVINRTSERRGGGVAGLERVDEPSENTAMGVVWSISDEDLRKLDGYEDRPTAYERFPLPVILETGEQRICETYWAIPQGSRIKPAPAYHQLMLEAAREVGLPPAYIAYLRSLDQ